MYFSPVRYGFTALMISQFPVPGYPYTEDILVTYGLQDASFGRCVLMLFLLFIMFRSLVILSLMLQDRKAAKSRNDTRNLHIPATKRQGGAEASKRDRA